MLRRILVPARFAGMTFALLCSVAFGAETFRVATYNVENYLDQTTESRHFVKSDAAKAKIRQSIRGHESRCDCV